ncbi:MAG: starch-binding protein, partial [Lachnospiraceae bacterium]|nr:starch-binding protein [Lachnospiraceae bacterium]
MGFRKCSMKILASILTFLMVCSAIFTDGVISSIQLAYADQGVKDAQPAEEAEAALEEDSQDTNMWYNPNSSMQDFRDETIYFVMTTRFFDGDPSNNVQSWEGTSYNGDETPWKGDFKGLIEKLDYIKALGFTAIWITPIVKNASGYDYHGYHALNFKEVDSRYESDDCTYQDLIDAVHARGMKIIQDVVFNHTGNFGEENLLNLFSRDDNANLAEITECMLPNPAFFPMDYFSLEPGLQYQMRLDYMKDLQGTGKDEKNLWHHFGNFNWDDYTCQLAQIAGDCVDLNTENPIVYKYLVEAYGQYIKMGVDAFRVDTVRHMSRLSLNNGFISQLNDIYNDVHGTTGERNFYMFGEVCTRYSSVWYREVPALSTPFYTWKESKEYPWIDDENDLKAYETNMASAEAHYEDNSTAADIAKQPTSDNAFLKGNEYHTPDYSMSSGLDVIDFPMHWNFKEASGAYNIAVSSDKWYNDATYNVVYVDSHDYAPDHAPEDERYAGSQEQWAENLSLMFTFRGIPCIYYGSEVEFMKGAPIDKGPNIAINETGRAYFGDYIEGSVDVADFARYTNATGAMKDTLNHPLSLHIQRLNRLRASVPALRKGQYSTEGCEGKFAYKRRYTDSTTDSFALIALTSDAEFTGIPNGKYTDAITGDVKNVTDGTLSTSGINGKGDLRVYVLDTALTKAPGLIEGHSDYMSGEGGDVKVDTIKPTGITMTGETTCTLDLGETCTFTAEVSPADATNKIITWSSSDTSVATVSGNGKVTGKGEGAATIYAATSNAESADYTNNSGLVAKAQVTVKASGIKVTSIVLSKNAVTLEEGKAEKITTTIVPGNASPNYAALTWSSADTSVAKVSSNGIITAVKAGKTTITVSTVSGVSATIDVQVKGAEVHGNAIYFKKPSGWGDKVYAYLWAKDAAGTVTWKNKAWPGETMILTDEKEGIYGVSWPDGQTDINVVFSDGSNQTDDLKPVINACIDNSGNIVKDEIPTNASNEKEGKVIVKYVDESGNEVEQSKVLTGTVGVVYTTAAVKVEGYTLKSNPDNATGVYEETDITVTYVYQKSTTPTPEKKGKVIVRYVDESDNEIKTSKTLTGVVGEDYETAEANIAGYTLKASPENAKGKYTEEDIIVTYVYQKNDINEKTGKVIVRYVDESDNEIKASTTLTGMVGADYETAEAEIEGYTLKTSPENAKGKYTESDITVTYVYQKNQVTEKTGKVIVRYVDESDNEIKASTTLTGTVGADYETAEAEIEGYTLKTSPANAKGKYTESDITVTYVYKKNTTTEYKEVSISS